MGGLLMEQLHFAKGIDPIADAFSGTVYSDIYSMLNLGRGLFVIYVGVGATGTSTITVEASDDVSGSNTTAVPFRYQEITSGDTQGTITAATTAGFTTTAGSSKIILIEVLEEELGDTGYEFVRLKAVESTDSPVLGGVMFVGADKRHNNISSILS